jgi:hypothetical protein
VDQLITGKRLAVLGLLLLLGSIPVYWWLRPDPRLIQLQQLQRELASEQTRKLPIVEQYRLYQQFQQQSGDLSARQQRALHDERRQLVLEKIDTFLALPPDAQTSYLNAEIDRLVALRDLQEAEKADQPQARRSRARAATKDQRERILKQQLDSTTPDQRAKLGQFYRQLADQLKARGYLPANFTLPTWIQNL